ncbi:MAG: hypothetical protein LBS96_04585 [Oscillospiraceae bacterium]|jgi:hypothetical protein|nr:hypothetical protein [Oscillospiraceae bacterium]
MKKTSDLTASRREVFQGRALALLNRVPGVVSLFFRLQNRRTAGFFGHWGYAFRRWPELVTAFGCEDGGRPVVAYIDGSYLLREGGRRRITFGVRRIPGKIDWSLREGWLPCPVSQYEKRGVRYTIESFCAGLGDETVVFTRMTAENRSAAAVKLPKVSGDLVRLGDPPPRAVQPGATCVLEYAVAARRGAALALLQTAGGWEAQYARMKAGWERRLEPLLTIEELPAPELINALRAGFVFTMIFRKGGELRTGGNGYERVFDHDAVGILAALLTVGETERFPEYAAHILAHLQYPDARWKLPWVYALYYMKTGDLKPARDAWEELTARHRALLEEMEPGGIMRKTAAIDSYGHWLCDNWSALLGLGAYAFLAERLGRSAVAAAARAQYYRLAKGVSQALNRTMQRHKLTYLPMDTENPNELGARKNPLDANWASMFLFGRWAWDGYLLHLPQGGVMTEAIDATYAHGFRRREQAGATGAAAANFGGYPHGMFSSAYNAGYAAAALRGEKYRDLGVQAYLFMLRESQSGPFSWWEGVRPPRAKSPWNRPHAAGGGGACPHMWGQATCTKALIESLVAQRADGTLLLGRGVPVEWIADGQVIALRNIPALGRRFGFRIETHGSRITLQVSDLPADMRVSLELPIFNVRKVLTVTGGAWEPAAGRVLLAEGGAEATVELVY